MTPASPKIHRVRYETFGGIVSSLDPPFLAWVDKEFMRAMGYEGSPVWDREPGHLSAPTEVHMAVTNRCSQGCEGCYMDSSGRSDELSTEELKNVLKRLADMGVFHVALGGGEAFEREDFGEIVSYCREIGLVPNLTTNGQHIGKREIEICRQMGQVNVSIDGVGAHYPVNGRRGSFAAADRSIRRLKKAGVQVGVNCVVSCKNWGHIEKIVSYAAKRKLNEIEFLKYKPSGRGRQSYAEHALSQEMIREFYPMLMRLRRCYDVELKIDCSFIPALVWHRPPKAELEKLAVTGCDGGNLLLAVHSNGTMCGCSFVDNDEPVGQIEQRWHSSAHLAAFRGLVRNAAEPCQTCEYLDICRCGCRAVALHLTGDFGAPDPECPRVVDRHEEKPK